MVKKKYVLALGLSLALISNGVVFGQTNNLDYNLYKKGMKNEDIKIIQQALKRDGLYNHEEFTTYFGPITQKAVKGFQKKYSLNSDGVVGVNTLSKMKSLGLIDFTTNETVSRGTKRSIYGEYLDWWKEVKDKLVKRGLVLEIQDVNTGLKFKVKATYGTNHADIEAVSSNDTATIKKIWGGFSWERRPVLVKINNRTIAASMNGMPHAGKEKYPEGKYISNRSGGFGKGYNYDKVKGNAMEGVVCLHFKNSLLHTNNKQDLKHQEAVKKAAGKK